MITHIHVRFAENQKDKNPAILAELTSALALVRNGPVFIIGSWQTGDFGHVYAAAVRHFRDDPETPPPFSILVVQAEGFGVNFLLKDIEFSVRSVSERRNGTFTLLHTDAISKNRAIAAMTELMKAENAREPFDATFWAEAAVKKMTQGQPLTDVWASLSRAEDKEHYKDYDRVCQSFMEAYIKRFGLSTGREQFVCIWGRTSGTPTWKRPLGGANPQYDSSERGNHQLCKAIKEGVTGLKAIFTVGDGFHGLTTSLPYVFNLGEFWKRMNVTKGRFQENGFFDFMTAFYDCDVVHVGMKSGGMDTLGLWGQKVVFIDSERSPEVTKGRVAAWSTPHLKPVPISQMPTPLGKAIEEARGQDSRAFKTTFSSEKQVQSMEEISDLLSLDDLFTTKDIVKIVGAVKAMLA
jgi:hypothetical protein